MSAIAIRCEGLSKRYRLGPRERYKTLRDALVEAARAPVRGLRAILAGGNGTGPAGIDTIWALKDVNLDVAHGEVLGIIGPNGAGKSTLLKILSRITEPTEGSATICGRVGSLLEIGTGFHPELTGRENVYLNGAILGMRKAEIARKFDEIIAFAEVEPFLDTPVKHFSSGMYVRLAFAVAAHLEPEILLVDEVLAVGDVAFQKKCLGKIGDVAREGRTVLFVSHNMGAIAKFTRRCVLLDHGRTVKEGAPDRVIAAYLNSSFPQTSEVLYPEDAAKEAQILRLALRNSRGELTPTLDPDEPITVEVDFLVRRLARRMHVAFMIELPDGTPVCSSATSDAPDLPDAWPAGRHRVQMTVPGRLLNCGQYVVRTGLGRTDGMVIDYHGTDGLSWEITDVIHDDPTAIRPRPRDGLLALAPEYRVVAVR